MRCPAGLCSGEKQKEAKISRGALAGAFAIPLSRRAAEKILVRVLCYKLLCLPWCWWLSSLYPPLLLFFLIRPWAKCTGGVPLLSFCVPKTGCFLCFLSPISAFAALAWSSPAVTGFLHLLGLRPSVQKRRQGEGFSIPCFLSLVLIRGLCSQSLPGCLLQPDDECFLHLWKWKRILVLCNWWLASREACVCVQHAHTPEWSPTELGCKKCCRNREAGLCFWAL